MTTEPTTLLELVEELATLYGIQRFINSPQLICILSQMNPVCLYTSVISAVST
jgi:hypothetical protein